jgi:transcriptional regulator with XRE-family HTH domain
MTHTVRRLPPAQNTEVGAANAPKALTKQEFGRRLAALMRERNWNQSDLARSAKIGRDAISTYVRGRSWPEPKSLKKLADAFQMEPQQLLPNSLMEALDEELPALEIKQAVGHPDKCWLRVNQMVTMEQALQVAQILQPTK